MTEIRREFCPLSENCQIYQNFSNKGGFVSQDNRVIIYEDPNSDRMIRSCLAVMSKNDPALRCSYLGMYNDLMRLVRAIYNKTKYD